MDRLNGGVKSIVGVLAPIGTGVFARMADLAPSIEVISMGVGICIAVIIGWNKLMNGRLERKEKKLDIDRKVKDNRLMDDLFKDKK